MGGEERWCVVTGGRGFAARHLVVMLIKQGLFSVRVADLAPTIKLDSDEENGVLGEAFTCGRAEYVSADVRDKSQVLEACRGAEVVFHTAAPDPAINSYKLHYSVSVQGTKNVIDASIELKVKRLIYTSSMGVVDDGVHEILNGNESLPYPSKPYDSYTATKAQGEALVIESNGLNGLLTCCIRPSALFGPGDKLFVPYLAAAARTGKAKFIIGDGNNVFDFSYVENVAHAHICAERVLASEKEVAEKAAGQAYFITDMEPVKFWQFMTLILEGLGYGRPKFKIPVSIVMPIAYMVPLTYKILAPYGMKAPQLTPPRIRLMSSSRTFNCSKAKDRLGYTPIVSLQEGIRRTIESYPHLRADVQTKTGNDDGTLMWMNKKQKLTLVLVLAAFYFSFIATGNSGTVTAVSKLLLAAFFFLFICGKLAR